MASKLASALQLILPKKSNKKGGVANTGTFDPTADGGVITEPLYRDHLTDIFNSRTSENSQELIKRLMVHDPDMAAATNAYLTTANTEPVFYVYDLNGEISRDGLKLLEGIIMNLTSRFDYTLGFQLRPNMKGICEQIRYMVLMRGGTGAELVLNDNLIPSEIRMVDLASITWVEKKPGQYKPTQVVNDKEINLDIPSFFVSHLRRDPTTIYSYSFFVSAINTIAARQQVINDLYRIMKITGFPRIEIKVLEEVLRKNIPASIANNIEEQKKWIRDRLTEVAGSFSNLRPDQVYVHTDSVETKMMNDNKPGAALNIDSVIATLNAQNQAGLRVMATVIGRGESGANTGTTEARIFSMNAEELNEPVSEILSGILSLAMHLQGFQGWVKVQFRKVDLRPELELEPQLTMKSSRLKQDLSLGIITDDHYHLEMYGRIRPDSAPELSGTNFMPSTNVQVEADAVSPNSDPMGRSLAPSGSKSAKSNNVK